MGTKDCHKLSLFKKEKSQWRFKKKKKRFRFSCQGTQDELGQKLFRRTLIHLAQDQGGQEQVVKTKIREGSSQQSYMNGISECLPKTEAESCDVPWRGKKKKEKKEECVCLCLLVGWFIYPETNKVPTSSCQH